MWASQAHPGVYFTSQVATDEVIYGTLMCSPALHGQHPRQRWTAVDSGGQRVVFTDTQIYITSCLDHLMATKHHQAAAEINDFKFEPTCHQSIITYYFIVNKKVEV